MNNGKGKLTLLEEIPEKPTKEEINNMNAFSNKLEELEKKVTELDERIENSQTNVIEALALFAAFFTFVAVNVQIFTRVTDLYSASWFTVLLLGALGFFAILVGVIIRKDNKLSILLSFIFMFFIACSLYVTKDVKLNNTENQENIKIENQGSSVEIKDNNIPIEIEPIKETNSSSQRH